MLQKMTEHDSAIIKILIGAIIGALITYWRTKYTVHSSDFSKRIEIVCKMIDDYAECACRYWSKLKSSDELKSNPHYIVGLQSRLATLLKSMDDDYSGFESSNIMQLLHELNDECTGGNFNNVSNDEAHKVAAILNLAEKLKGEIFKIRNQKY